MNSQRNIQANKYSNNKIFKQKSIHEISKERNIKAKTFSKKYPSKEIVKQRYIQAKKYLSKEIFKQRNIQAKILNLWNIFKEGNMQAKKYSIKEIFKLWNIQGKKYPSNEIFKEIAKKRNIQAKKARKKVKP